MLNLEGDFDEEQDICSLKSLSYKAGIKINLTSEWQIVLTCLQVWYFEKHTALST